MQFFLKCPDTQEIIWTHCTLEKYICRKNCLSRSFKLVFVIGQYLPSCLASFTRLGNPQENIGHKFLKCSDNCEFLHEMRLYTGSKASCQVQGHALYAGLGFIYFMFKTCLAKILIEYFPCIGVLKVW